MRGRTLTGGATCLLSSLAVLCGLLVVPGSHATEATVVIGGDTGTKTPAAIPAKPDGSLFVIKLKPGTAPAEDELRKRIETTGGQLLQKIGDGVWVARLGEKGVSAVKELEAVLEVEPAEGPAPQGSGNPVNTIEDIYGDTGEFLRSLDKP